MIINNNNNNNQKKKVIGGNVNGTTRERRGRFGPEIFFLDFLFFFFFFFGLLPSFLPYFLSFCQFCFGTWFSPTLPPLHLFLALSFYSMSNIFFLQQKSVSFDSMRFYWVFTEFYWFVMDSTLKLILQFHFFKSIEVDEENVPR